jgi:hypothetical protein
MFVESEIGKKKTFTGTSGKKFNYTFVPAIVTKIYQNYYELSTKTLAAYSELQSFLDLPVDGKSIQERLDKGKEFQEIATEANTLGLKIIKLVLTKNPQEDKLPTDEKELEEYIETEMSVDDMNQFIMAVCSLNPQEKKR